MIGRASRLALAAFVLASGPAAFGAERGTGAILPGGNSKQPINIEAVKLDYFDKEQKLVYTGGVVAVQGDSTLKASVLTIFLVPKAADGAAASGSTGRVQRMLAAGPVTLLQKDQVGTGDAGVYEKGTNSVVLTGNVTLTQGADVTKGDKLTYDLKTGQAVVTGRVKSLFLPGTSAGAGSADAAPAPDAPPSKRAGRRGAAASSASGL